MEKITRKYSIWVLAGLLIIAAVVAGYQYRKASAMKINVENSYNRAFHELVDYVDDINTLLEKSMLVSSPGQMATISGELFRETAAAKACLGQLPISEIQLEKTENFLAQVGDYTYVLSQKSIYNEEITDEDYNNLSSLSDYAANLSGELLTLQNEVYAGNISFGEMKAKEAASNTVNAAGGDMASGFENVEKQFQEYPSLIYDGPFSEHIKQINPVMTENAKLFTAEEAMAKAKEFLGNWGANLQSDGESSNTLLDSYIYRGTGENENESVYAAFTKKGAYPLYFLINREVGEEKITVENAISRARGYLYERGFNSMKDSYYDKSNGIATVNFAYEQGNVICYSDLIKVKVALDNGEIIGFESQGYIMNHKQREIATPALGENDAKSKINKHLGAEGVSLALIPKDSKKEVLCYEIKGNHKDRNFLIYINAQNGREEQILMLIESENGILTA